MAVFKPAPCQNVVNGTVLKKALAHVVSSLMENVLHHEKICLRSFRQRPTLNGLYSN